MDRKAKEFAVFRSFWEAGFKAPVVNDVRAEIWTKLWGNSSFNPISALTHATLEDICKFGPTRALATDMMRETQAIGEALEFASAFLWKSASPVRKLLALIRRRCSRTSKQGE